MGVVFGIRSFSYSKEFFRIRERSYSKDNAHMAGLPTLIYSGASVVILIAHSLKKPFFTKIRKINKLWSPTVSKRFELKIWACAHWIQRTIFFRNLYPDHPPKVSDPFSPRNFWNFAIFDNISKTMGRRDIPMAYSCSLVHSASGDTWDDNLGPKL